MACCSSSLTLIWVLCNLFRVESDSWPTTIRFLCNPIRKAKKLNFYSGDFQLKNFWMIGNRAVCKPHLPILAEKMKRSNNNIPHATVSGGYNWVHISIQKNLFCFTTRPGVSNSNLFAVCDLATVQDLHV